MNHGIKKWWWIAGGVTALLLVVALAGLFWALTHRNRSVSLTTKPTLVLRIDTRLTDKQKSDITAAMSEYLSGNGKALVVDNNAQAADFNISLDGGNRNEQPVAWQQQAQPLKLASGEVLTPTKQPYVYFSYSDSALTKTVNNYDIGQLSARLQDLFKTSSQTWTLNALGDIIIGRTVYEQEMRRNDYTSSFAKVASNAKDADFTIANAEWTAADGLGYPLAGMTFISPTRSLDGLTFAGIDAVSLANNHSMNGGVGPFESMMNSLKARNIGYYGAGHNFTEAHSPYIATVNGTKVALLGYSAIPGDVEAGPSNTGIAFMKIPPWYPTNESYIAQMEADIRAAKAQADVVIPVFHWSEEYTHQQSEHMRKVAHRAIDAGATMVVGSHPHWVQGIEWYNGHLITYSLGNFVFDQEQMLETKQGMFLTATFDGANLIGAKYTPIQIEQYFQPHLLDGAAAQKVLNDVYSHSWWPMQ